MSSPPIHIHPRHRFDLIVAVPPSPLPLSVLVSSPFPAALWTWTHFCLVSSARRGSFNLLSTKVCSAPQVPQEYFSLWHLHYAWSMCMRVCVCRRRLWHLPLGSLINLLAPIARQTSTQIFLWIFCVFFLGFPLVSLPNEWIFASCIFCSAQSKFKLRATTAAKDFKANIMKLNPSIERLRCSTNR